MTQGTGATHDTARLELAVTELVRFRAKVRSQALSNIKGAVSAGLPKELLAECDAVRAHLAEPEIRCGLKDQKDAPSTWSLKL